MKHSKGKATVSHRLSPHTIMLRRTETLRKRGDGHRRRKESMEERAQEEREQERENEVTKQTGRGYN